MPMRAARRREGRAAVSPEAPDILRTTEALLRVRLRGLHPSERAQRRRWLAGRARGLKRSTFMGWIKDTKADMLSKEAAAASRRGASSSRRSSTPP